MAEDVLSLQRHEMGSAAGNTRAVAATSVPSPGSTGAAICDELVRSARVLQLAIPSREICERVHRAVEEAASRDAVSMESLRLAVCEFTVTLRTGGATPGAVLVALKTLVNAGAGPIISRSLSDWSGYRLREKISTWCIDEYFR